MQCIGIIPARYESQRLPGKPLADIAGKPMIQWVYERALQSQYLSEVIIATDDARIYDAVQAFGGRAQMTADTHQSGTDRIAEVAAQSEADIVVNIQGDEPLIEPEVIDASIAPLIEDVSVEMGTIACPLDQDDLHDPNVVKVVFNRDNRALYFSRAPIPYPQGIESQGAQNIYWQHIGLYVYRREFLLQFTQYQSTTLERVERLEQLRALEHGHQIYVEPTEYQSRSVDTPEDLERVRQTFQTLREYS
ncbi:MAG: 3-deoxy-manno-octulosonate cytidylyltransferase [Candidatus Marinimicrobia bacterium]|nr:3-deoxy-manno-octulosonate cytidylyltransferase [Candidatus Neomarinimicrobiota bacterium]